MAIAISWKVINDAVEFYRHRGYKYIEVPWVVSRTAALSTLASNVPENRIFKILRDGAIDGCLVGSAEQSFIQLHFDGHLSLDNPGKFVACTPCFRNEPEIDNLHQQTFMKVELFSNISDHYKASEIMIDDATDFFRCFTFARNIKKIMTTEGYDLEIAGIEVGSYGMRQYITDSWHLQWVCGTGVAEPRFSTALKTL